MVIDGKKLCCKCNRLLPVEEFNAHNRMKDGLQSYCRACQMEVIKNRKKKSWLMHISYHLAESSFKQLRCEVYLPEQETFAECVIDKPVFHYGRFTEETKTRVVAAIRKALKGQMKRPPTKKAIAPLIKFE